MLAIVPLVMMAIVPDYIGEADASNEHLIAIAKLKELNKAPEMPTAELSLVQMLEPKETRSFSVKGKTWNQFIGFVPVDNTPTYQVHYKVFNAVDSDVRDIEISVSSDTETVSGKLTGDLDMKRGNYIISVMLKAKDPASINAEITGFDFK